jgi:hypothetical protein
VAWACLSKERTSSVASLYRWTPLPAARGCEKSCSDAHCFSGGCSVDPAFSAFLNGGCPSRCRDLTSLVRPAPPYDGARPALDRGATRRGTSADPGHLQARHAGGFRNVRKSGGGGNRTRVRGCPDRTSTSVVRTWISPAGRCTDDLPTGQPSFGVAPRAIGSPLAPSPFVGAATPATGRARSDASPNRG